MIAAIAEVFQFRPDWHRHDRAIPLVRQYELKLTAVLEADPDLHDCLAHCCHCGMRFLTYRCNRERRDLRCPFGCRQQQRRQPANARSQKYYRTPQGRKRKEEHNSSRCPIDQHEPPAHQERPSCDQSTHDQSTLQREPPPRQVPPPSASPVEQPSALHLSSPRAPSLEAQGERLGRAAGENSPDQARSFAALSRCLGDGEKAWICAARGNQRSHENASPADISLTDDVALTETWTLELEGVTLTNKTLERSTLNFRVVKLVKSFGLDKSLDDFRYNIQP